MTNAEKVLNQLVVNPQGLTAAELQDLTSIEKNTLGTVLWQLKRDGYVHVSGGARGRSRYSVTREGRSQLPLGGQAPLLPLEEQPGLPPADFDAINLVARNITTYRTLRAFTGWLVQERAMLLSDPEAAQEQLHGAVLAYLGVNASDLRDQMKTLESLLKSLE